MGSCLSSKSPAIVDGGFHDGAKPAPQISRYSKDPLSTAPPESFGKVQSKTDRVIYPKRDGDERSKITTNKDD